ncbi:MAG: Uncharacterised protein [Methanobacteriota archaeon]|nr:MAG: Uncharacterised protein [Euryarchaeota archaeon]
MSVMVTVATWGAPISMYNEVTNPVNTGASSTDCIDTGSD